MSDLATVAASEPATSLLAALKERRPVLVNADPRQLPAEVTERLLETALRPGVASASPVPVAGVGRAVAYWRSELSPPAPTLALPCRTLCLISPSAAATLDIERLQGDDVASLLTPIGERMVQHGWRHVAAPGVALDWDPADASGITATAGWTATAIESIVGPANTSLDAHQVWARSRVGSPRVVVDGACMSSEPFTGTQHLVLEVTRWMALSRPAANVSLAVPGESVNAVAGALAGSAVTVVERKLPIDADVVYRPYQMLYAGELDFVLGAGRRGIVGQLDMIGFSNPFYHPSDQLYFFARNLQRHLMRTLDGVTFISEFGRESAVAECPDLDAQRLHVVYCGSDPQVRTGELSPERGLAPDAELVVCLASTFWHKNRAHAIATFASMAERHGYRGQLVIAGPEPYYGRSLAEEDALLDALPDDVARRVHRWGHISDAEKWWLLEHAQVVLYPSIVEGFGLVPFEAAAAGTPCLVNDATAPGELLGKTDAVVPSWHPDDWADRAHRLASDPAHAAALVDSVRRAGAGLTWEQSAIRTWDAIDAALAAPRRDRHGEDGAGLARVAGAGTHVAAPLRMRFDVARVLPAVRTRWRRLAARLPWPNRTRT